MCSMFVHLMSLKIDNKLLFLMYEIELQLFGGSHKLLFFITLPYNV